LDLQNIVIFSGELLVACEPQCGAIKAARANCSQAAIDWQVDADNVTV
jgi:hypothetical protein